MWELVGQDHILRRLEAGLKAGQLAHAYLLAGPQHVGKMTLAVELAKALNCLEQDGAPCGSCVQCTRIAAGNHADIRIVGVAPREEGDPTRTVIGIPEVREVLHQVSLKPYEGSQIVVIFDGVEALSDEGANALLKTLEEPPDEVTFLLLSSNEESLLSTIRSRCSLLSLLPVPQRQMIEALTARESVEVERAAELARLSRGCYGWAYRVLHGTEVWEAREQTLDRVYEVCRAGLAERFEYASELATQFSRERETARQVLFEWQRWWRDLLLIKEGAESYMHNADRDEELRLHATSVTTQQAVGFLERLQTTLEALDRNANPRLACEVLMLNLPKVAAGP